MVARVLERLAEREVQVHAVRFIDRRSPSRARIAARSVSVKRKVLRLARLQ